MEIRKIWFYYNFASKPLDMVIT